MGITTKELADMCGVSRTTVTRALSGKGSVKRTTKERILSTAKEHEYSPDLVARSLVKGKSHMIGIVMANLSNMYFSHIVEAISQRAKSRGYMVSICTHEDDKSVEKILIEALRGYHVDGLILYCINKDEMFQQWLEKLGIPCVLIGYKMFKNNYTVGIDEKASAEASVDYIISRGYRKIAFIVPPLYDTDGEADTCHQRRYFGFLEAAKKNNCDHTVFYGENINERALKHLQGCKEGKVAFLCSGQIYAISLLVYLMKHGYKNPEDFGLMSFDKVWSDMEEVKRIDSVDNKADMLGISAADILIDLIEGKKTSQNTQIPYELVEGDSL